MILKSAGNAFLILGLSLFVGGAALAKSCVLDASVEYVPGDDWAMPHWNFYCDGTEESLKPTNLRIADESTLLQAVTGWQSYIMSQYGVHTLNACQRRESETRDGNGYRVVTVGYTCFFGN